MKAIATYGWLAAVAVACWAMNPAELPADDAEAAPDAKGVEFFEKHIRPVLTQQCYKCHSQGSTKLKGELLLDTRDGSRMGGETGPAVVPGNLDESLLISALKHEQFEMPPGNKLPDDVIAKFEQWIEMGAPDPRDGKAVIVGKRDINIEEGRKFWAFQLPKKAAPPAVKQNDWPRDDVDRFVLAKLEEQSLSPVADATPRELVRRLYFDILGLPPTVEEMEKWTARLTAPQREARGGGELPAARNALPVGSGLNEEALAQFVDELLASPRFGERWGRHWLDVARYADSNGNVDNTPFEQAWRYRNWVVDALNADMPYDQFITEQLAGDLLPYDSPQQRNAKLIATGFLAIGSKPRPQNNPNYAMDVVAEQIEVTTTGMLGLTVACARCHDHKFDPIPTSEYYAMAGIFTSSRTLFGSQDNKVNDKKNKKASAGGLISLLADGDAAKGKLAELAQQKQRLESRKGEIVAELGRLGASVAPEAKGKNKNQQVKQQQKAIAQQLKKLQGRLDKVTAAGDKRKIERVKSEIAKLEQEQRESKGQVDRSKVTDKDRVNELRDELAKIEADLAENNSQSGGDQQAMGVLEGRAGDCAICLAGESTDRGPMVPRGTISVATIGEPLTINSSDSGRLQLAEWIASEKNPLTARVMVNRIWQHLLGRGLVKSVDNFGQLGERPTHPELLDHLAVQFMEEGWSVKQMIRHIVLTRTYQMSSTHDAASYEKDPGNVWLWRMSPQRLDAESFRDTILAFSGKLDLNRPERTFTIEPQGKRIVPKAEESNYRSVYLSIVRNGEPEALTLFDFADPSIVVGHREETTVPSQSLYLLNSPFVQQNARAAAERLLRDQESTMSDAERVEQVYLAAFGRRPTDEQRERALAYVSTAVGEGREKNEARQLTAWTRLCQSLIAAAEFRYID